MHIPRYEIDLASTVGKSTRQVCRFISPVQEAERPQTAIIKEERIWQKG